MTIDIFSHEDICTDRRNISENQPNPKTPNPKNSATEHGNTLPHRRMTTYQDALQPDQVTNRTSQAKSRAVQYAKSYSEHVCTLVRPNQ